jgi:hypothetical protein
LLPGQAIVTPAAQGAAMMVFVELTLEAVFDVVHVLEAVLDE